MSRFGSLRDMMIQIRSGDQTAATEFHNRYQQHLKRWVRRRLRHAQLRSLLDTVDVTQEIWVRLFELVRKERFLPVDEEELLRMLAVLSDRVIDLQRRFHHRQRRNITQTVQLNEPGHAATGNSGPEPEENVEVQESLTLVNHLLTREEREILQARGDGATWAELAEPRGTTAEALRKRITRRLREISERLNGPDQNRDV